MLLIGSRALAIFYPEYTKDRNIIDWDFICTKNEFKELVQNVLKAGNKLVEINFLAGTNHGHAKFINKETGKLEVLEASFTDVESALQVSDIEIHSNYTCYVPSPITILGFLAEINLCSPTGLYILKLSHKYKKNSVFFDKTRADILFFQSQNDIGKFTSYDYDVLAHREKLTYNYSHPKLNTSKKDFFTDDVPYEYDHDSIHEAVKHLAKPAYTYYMKDGEQVMTDKEKFFAAPEIIRLYGVLEESYVLALERAIIPHGVDTDKAFKKALEKVCTSITSGWFREFAYDNYDKVMWLYHNSFKDKFQAALEAGIIKPYNGGYK